MRINLRSIHTHCTFFNLKKKVKIKHPLVKKSSFSTFQKRLCNITLSLQTRAPSMQTLLHTSFFRVSGSFLFSYSSVCFRWFPLSKHRTDCGMRRPELLCYASLLQFGICSLLQSLNFLSSTGDFIPSWPWFREIQNGKSARAPKSSGMIQIPYSDKRGTGIELE